MRARPPINPLDDLHSHPALNVLPVTFH